MIKGLIQALNKEVLKEQDEKLFRDIILESPTEDTFFELLEANSDKITLPKEVILAEEARRVELVKTLNEKFCNEAKRNNALSFKEGLKLYTSDDHITQMSTLNEAISREAAKRNGGNNLNFLKEEAEFLEFMALTEAEDFLKEYTDIDDNFDILGSDDEDDNYEDDDFDSDNSIDLGLDLDGDESEDEEDDNEDESDSSDSEDDEDKEDESDLEEEATAFAESLFNENYDEASLSFLESIEYAWPGSNQDENNIEIV